MLFITKAIPISYINSKCYYKFVRPTVEGLIMHAANLTFQ